MTSTVEYSRVERRSLWLLAAFGFFGLNAVFIYGLMRPELMRSALTNPVSLAFLVEALLLMVVLAVLLPKWGVARLHWTWFLGLSLLGSLAFALPLMLLWPAEASAERSREAEPS